MGTGENTLSNHTDLAYFTPASHVNGGLELHERTLICVVWASVISESVLVRILIRFPRALVLRESSHFLTERKAVRCVGSRSQPTLCPLPLPFYEGLLLLGLANADQSEQSQLVASAQKTGKAKRLDGSQKKLPLGSLWLHITSITEMKN